MENAYGIGITNRYALFLDEDADPLDILKQSEADQKLAKAKKIEEATKPAPKVVKNQSKTKMTVSEFMPLLFRSLVVN
jgi:plasminogen activator inhibitor 1 RNA-binding protein